MEVMKIQFEADTRRLNAMVAAMERDREPFFEYWRDIANLTRPMRPRFLREQRESKRIKRQGHIIDPTMQQASIVLRSGMMSGVSSPARPWTRLTVPDPDLAGFWPVKDWLYTVNDRMLSVFLKSNLYRVLPELYSDVGDFATGCMIAERDFGSVTRFTSVPIGSYMIALDARSLPAVFVRDFTMTVRQIIHKFGRENPSYSGSLMAAISNNRTEQEFQIIHIVEPNDDYKPQSGLAPFKKFSSVYAERGQLSSSGGKVISRSGMDIFRVMAPRWSVTEGDVYGTDCPGMMSIGGAKALQLMERRKAQAIEHKVKPNVIVPPSMRNQAVNFLPGGENYDVSQDAKAGLRPTFQVNMDIRELKDDEDEKRRWIQKAYHADLFMSITSMDRRDRTTRAEIEARVQEQLMAVGPVLEGLNDELFDPLIDIVFADMKEAGLLPEAPPELHGVELNVEYISIMHQAQKAVTLGVLERGAGFVLDLFAATQREEILDKIDWDMVVDEYHDASGSNPRILVPTEVANQVRADRAQAVAAERQRQNAIEGVKATKDLASAKLNQGSALDELVSQANAGQMLPA